MDMRSVRRRNLILTAFLGALAIGPACTSPERYDLLIRGGSVIDGTGRPAFRADLGIRGDRIATLAPEVAGEATRTVDATGLVVAPGFIDLHVHALGPVGSPPAVLPIVRLPTADNYVRQGVTTLITGPDGFSPVPLRPALDQIAQARLVPNLGTFVGHGSIRESVLGTVDRAPTEAEFERMEAHVREGMQRGALGLSTGLFYMPARFGTTDEVIRLARIAGQAGGIHISHMRDEASRLLDSVTETIAIGERGGLPTQITHHKAVGKPAWGKTVETLRMVDEARGRGVDVTFDVYPYTASSTFISAALLPSWAQEGGRQAVLGRLANRTERSRMRQGAVQLILEERGGGHPRNVQLATCDWDPSLNGRRLDDVTTARGLPMTVENAAETALWLVENGDCSGIYHAIDEEDLQRVLKHPTAMIASDGHVVAFGEAYPHPRSYGTFVRVLGRYVRDLKTLTLEDAVQKMTSAPAMRIGLADRGVLRDGMKADIVVFDPARVRDVSTFEMPHQYPDGIRTVIVNGEVVFDGQRMTEARPGRLVLRATTARQSR